MGCARWTGGMVGTGLVLLMGLAPSPTARAEDDEPSGATDATATGPTSAGEEPPAEATQGHPPLRATGYYAPRFRTDQRARVTVQCLGVKDAAATRARFVLEVHNDTERELEVLVGQSTLQWAREARAPRRGRIRPLRPKGPTTIQAGESDTVPITFELRGRPDPADVHTLQLQWTIRSALGSRSVHLSTFVRETRGGRTLYAFMPDPSHLPGPPLHRRW